MKSPADRSLRQVLEALHSLTEQLDGQWANTRDVATCQKIIDQCQEVLEHLSPTTGLSNLPEPGSKDYEETLALLLKTTKFAEHLLTAWQHQSTALTAEILRLRNARQRIKKLSRLETQGQAPHVDYRA